MTDCELCLKEKDGKCILFGEEMSALSCSYKEEKPEERKERRYLLEDTSLYHGTQILWEENEHNPHPVLEDDSFSGGGGDFGGGGASGDWDDCSCNDCSSCSCDSGSDD